MSRSLVDVEVFETKEEAEAYSVEGKILGDVAEGANGTYTVSYSEVGEWVVEAAKEAGEYYKLAVPLGMDYIVHKNWAGAH